MREYTEDNLQADCVKWYNNTFCLKTQNPRGIIFAVPNGGSRDPVEALKLRDTGVLRGVSDTELILPSKELIFVEFKIGKNKQSKEQKDFEKRVTALGFRYVVFWEMEEFKKFIYENT